MFDEAYPGFKPVIAQDGDALARMEVRAEEILKSCEIIRNTERSFSSEDKNEIKLGDGSSIGYAESPSGIVAYYIELKNGRISDVYISTPSVFGFKAFADSFEGFIFTDFSFAYDSYGINFADCAR
jgi:Ni,Fe-hydrogenase III large subunit